MWKAELRGRTLYLNGEKVPCVKNLTVRCDPSDVSELTITMDVSEIVPKDRKDQGNNSGDLGCKSNGMKQLFFEICRAYATGVLYGIAVLNLFNIGYWVYRGISYLVTLVR